MALKYLFLSLFVLVVCSQVFELSTFKIYKIIIGVQKIFGNERFGFKKSQLCDKFGYLLLQKLCCKLPQRL